MFDFLKSKRSKNKHAPSAALTTSTPTQQRNDVRRELVRVVLKDTLRHHGIPFGWLACEVIITARAPGEETLNIQLVVMKWNELLLRYACALQQQLLLGLDRFDPSVDHSKYIVSWRFSPDSGCPLAVMPDKTVWLPSTLPQVEEEPLPILDRRHKTRPPNGPKFDLPPPAKPVRPPSFSPTEVLPLR
jgi:hypothetical protein